MSKIGRIAVVSFVVIGMHYGATGAAAADPLDVHHYFSKVEHKRSVKWGYSGERGPDYWGTLSPKFRIPKDLSYQTYVGSFTIPPCTEGVRWILVTQAVEIRTRGSGGISTCHRQEQSTGSATAWPEGVDRCQCRQVKSKLRLTTLRVVAPECGMKTLFTLCLVFIRISLKGA